MIPRARRHPRYATGFTLVEIAVVLVIISIMIAMAALLTRGIAGAQKRSLTATRMAGVDVALIQFVMQQKRLPCPAVGTIATNGPGDPGVEAPVGGAPCANNQQFGVVPWVALGLSEQDVTDGWDRRLTYRVDPALTTLNAMDMSWCDPAGTEAAGGIPRPCNTACTGSALPSCTPLPAFLTTKGLTVKNVGGTTIIDPNAAPHTGAAYVLISHGESGGGGYLNSGTLSTSTVGDGAQETKNYASQAYVSPVATWYVDDSTMETPEHFDDLLSRPTVLSVASKAGLGPRSH